MDGTITVSIKKLVIGVIVFFVVGVMIAVAVLGGLAWPVFSIFLGQCITSNTQTVALYGSDNRSKIINYMISQGYTLKTAVGITASIRYESGYSPFRQEDSRSWPDGGYGIAQFTFGNRDAVVDQLRAELGSDFEAYHKPEYGGPVTAENGYVPQGVPQEINDKFLAAQLTFLSGKISELKPSSIRIRTRWFNTATTSPMTPNGLTVPSDATLHEYLLSIDDEKVGAIAWTTLYEAPGRIYETSEARANYATELLAEVAGQGSGDADMQIAGGRMGACGGVSTASWAGGALKPPLNGNMEINSLYGDTSVGLRTKPHQGIDLVDSYGIQSVAAGTVTFAAWNDGGYGNRIEIDHGNGFVSTYSHMASFEAGIVEGATIGAGQLLGVMGSTGKSTGNHLHFEVWLNDEHVDPEKFLAEHGMVIPREDGMDPSPYIAQAPVRGGAFEHHVSLQTAQRPPLSAAEQSRVAAGLSSQSSPAAMRLLHPLRKKGVFYYPLRNSKHSL